MEEASDAKCLRGCLERTKHFTKPLVRAAEYLKGAPERNLSLVFGGRRVGVGRLSN
jgi:hypothetical protein